MPPKKDDNEAYIRNIANHFVDSACIKAALEKGRYTREELLYFQNFLESRFAPLEIITLDEGEVGKHVERSRQNKIARSFNDMKCRFNEYSEKNHVLTPGSKYDPTGNVVYTTIFGIVALGFLALPKAVAMGALLAPPLVVAYSATYAGVFATVAIYNIVRAIYRAAKGKVRNMECIEASKKIVCEIEQAKTEIEDTPEITPNRSSEIDFRPLNPDLINGKKNREGSEIGEYTRLL